MIDKLLKIQQELKVPKDQTNDFGKYKYRSCEDILEMVKPICHAQGVVLSLSDEMVDIGGRVYVKVGSNIENFGNDNGLLTTCLP